MQKDYRSFALSLAEKAGKIMRKNFTLGMVKEIKSDNTPLTVTDTTINQMVVAAVRKTFPDHSIITEEGSHILPESSFAWICDPIDGTIPFSHGIPSFTFALALTKNGESILGVIYDPIMDRLFLAEKKQRSYTEQ